MYPVEIRTLPALTLYGIAHRGPYPQISTTFRRLGLMLEANGLAGRTAFWAGVYRDDPRQVPADRLRSHACCAFSGPELVPPEMQRIAISGGRSAVMTYRGPYSGLARTWAWLYAEGLPAGEIPRRAPPYEIYRSMFPAVAADEQITEVVVPPRPAPAQPRP